METLFTKQKKKSTVNIVIDSIWELLYEKKLKPGQKVPSEKEISEGLGVSRGSVREAMKILSAFGAVDIRPGDGTYIPTEMIKPIIEPIQLSFMLFEEGLKEVTELRRTLEIDIIEMVIQKAAINQEERKLLEDNMKEYEGKMHADDVPPEEFARLDLEFHRLLGLATHNSMLNRIYESVMGYYETPIMNTHYYQKHGERSFDVHMRILQSIRENDLEFGKKAITDSMDLWERYRYEGEKLKLK